MKSLVFIAIALLPAIGIAGDCGDLPCAATNPPAWMNEPTHLGGGNAKTGCVRWLVSSHRSMPRKVLLDNAGDLCGLDDAIARLIAEDELRSEGR